MSPRNHGTKIGRSGHRTGQQVNDRFPEEISKFPDPFLQHVKTTPKESATESPQRTFFSNNRDSRSENVSKISDEKGNRGGDSKRKISYQDEAFYNIYDLDKPVTVKQRNNPQLVMTKEKKEILNRTLSVHGLKLDPKGEKIILMDNERLTAKTKKQTEKREKENHKSREHERIKQKKADVSDSLRKHPIGKAEKQDPIKSLWDILKTVSRRWK